MHPGSQGSTGSAEPHNSYPHTSAHAQPIDPNFGHVCGEKRRLLCSQSSAAFRQEYHHKFIDALIDVSKVRERHPHSTSALLKTDTPRSGPSPWDKLPYSLLDAGLPVQPCCTFHSAWSFKCTLYKLMLLFIPSLETASSVTPDS